jgi:hypothetical protein
MKKYIRIWVTEKRMTRKIRSERSPLIKDYEIRLKLRSVKWELETFEVWNFLGSNSEKGCTRKDTGNRVARWGFLFWGNVGIYAVLRRELG